MKPFYQENPEPGPTNLTQKLERVKRGGEFETKDMWWLNQRVAEMVPPKSRVIELGGGTGMFAWHAAQRENAQVLSLEQDLETHNWAKCHRAHSHITYLSCPPMAAVQQRVVPFDLLVVIEVIEHISGYAAFIRDNLWLAPWAIYTTPNRLRYSKLRSGPPKTRLHVREWSPGEFYWVMRCFYGEVDMRSMELDGELCDVREDSKSPYLIASCRLPISSSGLAPEI